jgi:hypothetical protein
MTSVLPPDRSLRCLLVGELISAYNQKDGHNQWKLGHPFSLDTGANEQPARLHEQRRNVQLFDFIMQLVQDLVALEHRKVES